MSFTLGAFANKAKAVTTAAPGVASKAVDTARTAVSNVAASASKAKQAALLLQRAAEIYFDSDNVDDFNMALKTAKIQLKGEGVLNGGRTRRSRRGKATRRRKH